MPLAVAVAELGARRRPGLKQSTFMRWLVVWLLATAFLLWLSLSIRGAAALAKAGYEPVTDPRLDMVAALKAMGPHDREVHARPQRDELPRLLGR
jgi:hypothetical protein